KNSPAVPISPPGGTGRRTLASVRDDINVQRLCVRTTPRGTILTAWGWGITKHAGGDFGLPALRYEGTAGREFLPVLWLETLGSTRRAPSGRGYRPWRCHTARIDRRGDLAGTRRRT